MSTPRPIVSPAKLVLALFAGAIILGFAPDRAQAQRQRIVVMKFEGPRAARFQRAAVKALGKTHKIVSERQYRRTARKLKARALNDANVAAVATELGAAGVLFGKIQRRRRQFELILRLRDGTTGQEAAVVRIVSQQRRLSPGKQEELRTQVAAAIDNLPGVRTSGVGGAPAPQPDVVPNDGVVAGADDSGDDVDITFEDDALTNDDGNSDSGDDVDITFEDDALADQGDSGDDAGAGDDAGITFDEGAITGDIEDPPVITRRSDDDDSGADALTRGGLEVSLGSRLIQRNLTASVKPNIQGPEYEGQFAPSAYIDVEVYPLALPLPIPEVPGQSILKNFGIRATFDRVLSLKTQLPYVIPPSTEQQTENLDTEQMRFGGGLVSRWYFGKSANAPHLKVGVGYDRMRFSVDKSQAPEGVKVDLPNVDYASIDPSLTFHYPIMEGLKVIAGGRLLVVIDTGEMEQMDQYGDTKSVFGYDLGAELQYTIIPHVSVQAGGRFMQITTSFEGNGPESAGRDGNMATIDVTGVTDTYLGFHVTVGYAF